MKINLSDIDRTQFLVHESTCYGEPLYLVQPQHIGCTWTQENKIFRSSVWNDNGELVSAGLPKFTNWGENQDRFPTPNSLKSCVATEKVDGSLLIVSKYKGQIILRTRGTFDASIHDNGKELEIFKTKYSQVLESLDKNPNVSWCFEWVSPQQRIILNYGEDPEWYLVGIIDHFNYSLVPQDILEIVAMTLGLKRPLIYTFDTLETLLESIKLIKGKEGVCLYSNKGQTIHKIKSDWYLALHHLKSEISSPEKLIDTYIVWDMPDYLGFKQKIEEHFDYELFIQVQGTVSRICEAKKEADRIVEHMKLNIPKWKNLSRKDAALNIIDSYGQTTKKSIAFNLLDGKELDTKSWKTLILQSLS